MVKKYAIVVNDETKLCHVGTGSNYDFYISLGMTLQDVEQAFDGCWHLTGYCPEPTYEYKVSQVKFEIDENLSKIAEIKERVMEIQTDIVINSAENPDDPLIVELKKLRNIISLRMKITVDLLVRKYDGDQEAIDEYNSILQQISDLDNS